MLTLKLCHWAGLTVCRGEAWTIMDFFFGVRSWTLTTLDASTLPLRVRLSAPYLHYLHPKRVSNGIQESRPSISCGTTWTSLKDAACTNDLTCEQFGQPKFVFGSGGHLNSVSAMDFYSPTPQELQFLLSLAHLAVQARLGFGIQLKPPPVGSKGAIFVSFCNPNPIQGEGVGLWMFMAFLVAGRTFLQLHREETQLESSQEQLSYAGSLRA